MVAWLRDSSEVARSKKQLCYPQTGNGRNSGRLSRSPSLSVTCSIQGFARDVTRSEPREAHCHALFTCSLRTSVSRFVRTMEGEVSANYLCVSPTTDALRKRASVSSVKTLCVKKNYLMTLNWSHEHPSKTTKYHIASHRTFNSLPAVFM